MVSAAWVTGSVSAVDGDFVSEFRSADAELGREVRARRAAERPDVFDEERLREQMRREEAEVEEKIRQMREEVRKSPSPWDGDG